MAKPDSFDEDLAAGLKAAKSKRMHFVVVMKGSADGALILSKTKVPPADIAAAKKKSGGSSVIRGLCFGKDGEHVFETAKEPPATLARLLKTLAKRDANLVINAVCRVGNDPELAEADAAPASPPTPGAPAKAAATVAPSTAAAVATAAGPKAADPAGEWGRRSAAVANDLKRALAGKLGDTARISARYKAAAAAASSKQFAAAVAELSQVEALLRRRWLFRRPPPRPRRRCTCRKHCFGRKSRCGARRSSGCRCAGRPQLADSHQQFGRSIETSAGRQSATFSEDPSGSPQGAPRRRGERRGRSQRDSQHGR